MYDQTGPEFGTPGIYDTQSEATIEHPLDVEVSDLCRESYGQHGRCNTHYRIGFAGLPERQPMAVGTDDIVCIGAIEDVLDDLLDEAEEASTLAQAKVVKAKRKALGEAKQDRRYAEARRLGEVVTVLRTLRDTVHHLA